MSRIDNIYKPPYLGKGFNQHDAELAIAGYIANLKDFTRGSTASDILDFFPLVQAAITTKQDSEKISKDRRLLLLEDDPPEEIDTEAITWTLEKRCPGRFDKGPAGEGGVKEPLGHYRGSCQHPDNPNEHLISMGKFYGNWINFNIYARNSKKSLKRLLWLEQTMDSFHWYFRFFGFRVIELDAGPKEKVIIKDLELVRYNLLYFVRSDDTFHITAQDLKKVLVTTNVSTKEE